MFRYPFQSALIFSVCLGLVGCGVERGETTTSDDLTSQSAVERTLTITGLVYVEAGGSSYAIENAVQRQIRTAFGPLRVGKISVDDREFRKNIDPSTFVKTPLDVMKKDPQSGELSVVKKVDMVRYTYQARGLVEKSKAALTSFSMALLMGNYQSFVNDIIHQCVENYEHDQEFSSSFWYVFSANEYQCKTLIKKEVEAIAKERQGLHEGQLGEQEYNRRFLPVTVQLKAVAPPQVTYPEYDQLYGIDDPSKERIVVSQIVGVASHFGDPENERFENDMGFVEFFKTLDVLASQFQTLRVAKSSAVDLLSFSYKDQTYHASWQDLYNWVVRQQSFPAAIKYDDQRPFRRAIFDHIYLKWITLEVPLQVSSGRTSKDMTLELNFLFGTESGWNVKSYFAKAFSSSDVVLYDGHSYIGSGPLDPGNYRPADFSDRYQIFFFNSCVSFNYYGVDYFTLKNEGSKKLDLVTNGLEVWIRDGGLSMGQFIAALFDGKQRTWLDILKKTQISSWWGTVHDPNRAVDGELDNTYDPQVQPLTVKEGSSTPLAVTNTSAVCGQHASGTVELTAASNEAARVEFLVNGTAVGSDPSAPFGVAWDSTTVPNGTIEIIARAYDLNGHTAEAGCQVQVNNHHPADDLFFDDFESGSAQWTATGLWHLAQNSSCANPSYASPVHAFYFGDSSSCTFKQTGAVPQGSLTSKTIEGVTAQSKLSFKYYRDVEESSVGGYDKTLLEVAEGSSDTWRTMWSLDSKTPSTAVWSSSKEIALSEFAGKNIRLRFRFDAVDGYNNDKIGWLIDDIRLTR